MNNGKTAWNKSGPNAETQLIFNKSPVRLLIFAPPATHTSISESIDTPAVRQLSYILGGIGNSSPNKRPMWFAKGQAISLEWGLQTSSTSWDFCAPAKMFQWQPSQTPPIDAPDQAVPSTADNRTLRRLLEAMHDLSTATVPIPDGLIPTANVWKRTLIPYTPSGGKVSR